MKGISLYVFRGFMLGFLLCPAMLFQTQWAEHALNVDMACCEGSIEAAMALYFILGPILGPLLGVFTGATLYLCASRPRVAGVYASVGAVLCGFLPLIVVLTVWRDNEYRDEPNGAWLVAISVSLPLLWALGLGLWAMLLRLRKSVQP